MEFIKKNLKWIALGACVLAALSVFLPFASVSATVFGITASESITFIEGDGIILIVLVVIAAALLFLNNKKAKIASIALLAAGIVMTIYDAINASSAVADVAFGVAKVSLSIGFYLAIVGSVLAIAAIVYDTFFLNKAVVAGIAAVQPVPAEPVAPVQNTFVQPEVAQQTPVVVCPVCGTTSSYGTEVCGLCGNKLN